MSYGGGAYRGGGGRGRGGGGHGAAPPPPSGMPGPDGGVPAIQVMDMGLDFKSYQQFRTPDDIPIGNLTSFSTDDVAEAFEPTIGLFIAIIHLGMVTASPNAKKAWLATYKTLQQVYAAAGDGNPESISAAHDAVHAIESSAPDNRLFEHLLMLLDTQSQMASRGGQAPSQRRVQREPKGVLCNLHLSDRKCNQDFSCNQLHLIKTGDIIKHRDIFYAKVARTMQAIGLPDEEVNFRIMDLIFFSKFGNRVTLRYGSSWVQFFKTSYTRGRLAHALRRSSDVCVAAVSGGRCQLGHSCPGVHLQEQDQRGAAPSFSKQMDLPAQQLQDIYDSLQNEASRVWLLLGGAGTTTTTGATPPAPVVRQPQPQPTTTATAATVLGKVEMKPRELKPSPLPTPEALLQATATSGSLTDTASPTSRGWAAAVDQYKRVNNGQANPSADKQLLQHLETRPADSPVTPEEYTSTPLLQEVDKQRFGDVGNGRNNNHGGKPAK